MRARRPAKAVSRHQARENQAFPKNVVELSRENRVATANRRRTSRREVRAASRQAAQGGSASSESACARQRSAIRDRFATNRDMGTTRVRLASDGCGRSVRLGGFLERPQPTLRQAQLVEHSGRYFRSVPATRRAPRGWRACRALRIESVQITRLSPSASTGKQSVVQESKNRKEHNQQSQDRYASQASHRQTIGCGPRSRR